MTAPVPRRNSLRLAGAAALLAACPAAAQPVPADTIAQRLLDELHYTTGVPGFGAALWQNGRIVWTGSSGTRDAARGLLVDANTRFRMASISKIFAATAAAKLRQDKLLDVDAPVREMLPWLFNGWPAITTRQIAAHTAGIPHYQQPLDATIGSKPVPDMRAAVGIFSTRPLLSPPGTRFEYSTHGFTLLSAIVEARAGMPYLDYISRVIAPGLTISRDYTDRDPNASVPYIMLNGAPAAVPPRDYSYSWGGAGLGGTPSAIASWGGRVVTGKVVSPATLYWMIQPAKFNDGAAVYDGTYKMGFGWKTGTDSDGRPMMLHAGSTPGSRGVLIAFPGRAEALSLIGNAMFNAAIEKSALAIAAPLRTPPKLAKRPCPLRAARYTGSFNGEAISGTATFAVENGLCAATLTSANALGRWLTMQTQRQNPRVRFIGLDGGGGLSRGVMVTPFGAWEMRPDATGYTIQMAPGRTLTISFA